MIRKTETSFSLNHLQKLSAFAHYLLQKKLEEFIQKQLEYTYEQDIPLLRFFLAMTEDQRYDLSKATVTEFLGYLSQNKAAEQIEAAMQQWKTNQLPVVDRDSISAEDITLINYVRKKSMLHFLLDYTKDPYEIIELVGEIDFFIIESITAATNIYIDLFRKRVDEHSHFIKKVAETIPGAVYVFDVETYKGIYSNNKLPDVIGHDHADLNALGEKAIPSLIHPDDQENLQKQIENQRSAADGEVLLSKYRIRKKDGDYKWLANYESVFKRRDDGSVWQTIGITLDIDKEQKAADELHKREQQLLEAQDIAQLGNYYWDFKGKHSTASLKTIELLEIEPGDFENFLRKVHPDDRSKVRLETEKAFTTGIFNCEYRLRGKKGDRLIWARGIVECKGDTPVGMTGTVMDITEHSELVNRLAQADRRHKQAEVLTHLGTYTWNFITDEIEWSDEMYRIYEMEKGEQLSYGTVLNAVHADDKQLLDRTIKESIAAQKPYDFYYRIITKAGTEKILHSRGQIEKDDSGKPEKVVGTDQDVTEKQKLIRSLSKSESLYKQAEELAAMGNWSWDVATDKLEWTDQLYRIYGMEPKAVEMTNERFLSFVHPDDRAYVETGIDSISSEKSLDYTFRIITQDGAIKWLRSIAQVLRNADGQVTFVIGTEQDITEQYKTQADLRESQNFIRKITDATPSIIASYNVNTGVYTFISEGLQKLLGYDTNEVLQKGIAFFAEIVHPDDFPLLTDKNGKALEDANASGDAIDTVIEFIYRLKHKNGSYRWFHTYGTVFDRNAAGKVEHVLNISLDVTEQHEAIQTIKEQEHFIQQIADASPTILYLFDVPSQSMAYINREAFFVLGYLPEEIIEEDNNITRLLYHPDDMELLPCRAQSKKAFQQVDSMIQYECRMKHKDGNYRWLLVREIVFKTAQDGSIKQIIGAALDINRRKEMEKTILQNSMLLQQSNASLEEFAYVASHDLKEPLRKISTFGDRLVASQINNLSEDGKVYLRKIVDASQRMQSMISDLLSISMISGNRSFETFSLQKIVEETLQTLDYKIEQQRAVIHCSPLPEANIVPSQFRQLFQNLIANSLKFVRENIEPVISITCNFIGKEETANYHLTKAETYLKLAFSDNGIGFEKEYEQKIFAIFQRLHGRSEYEGSGIGLAICKKIVEHHGGVIFAHGQPGVGATFTIILPA
ncbi:MAG TPA: PAS domain-containing protein [Flavisolibacter sp.]|nr:PAS domain-containing protein [Flavisolibacter sp.]